MPRIVAVNFDVPAADIREDGVVAMRLRLQDECSLAFVTTRAE